MTCMASMPSGAASRASLASLAAFTDREVPSGRVQPHLFPGPRGNLPTHRKPVAGIGAVLVLVAGSGHSGRIGAVAEQGHQVVGVPENLLLAIPAPVPP